MKLALLFVLSLTSLLAENKFDNFLSAYEDKNYHLACEIGRELFRDDLHDESLLIAIGQSCAEDDYIDFNVALQRRLGKSADSRRAAVYFSTLVLQKRLLSQFMYEGVDLSQYSLPKTEHILSIIFDAIKNKRYTVIRNKPKHLRIGNEENYIDLSVEKKIHVDVYQNKTKIQEHRYRR